MSEGGVFLGTVGQRFPWLTPLESVEQCQETTGSHLGQQGAAWLNVALLLQTSRKPSSSLTGLVMPRSPSARLAISSGHWGRTLQMQRSTKSWETPAKRVSALQPSGLLLTLGNSSQATPIVTAGETGAFALMGEQGGLYHSMWYFPHSFGREGC